MNKKKLCIIIPVYNEEKTLRQLIDKIIAQDIPTYEVIFVDAMS